MTKMYSIKRTYSKPYIAKVLARLQTEKTELLASDPPFTEEADQTQVLIDAWQAKYDAMP